MKRRIDVGNYVGYMKSPVGWLKVVVSDKGLKHIDYVYKVGKKKEKHPRLEGVIAQLEEYFVGKRKKFLIPVDLDGTEFQATVWRELMKIPYGKVVSYADIAQGVGKPTAVRAVGNANGKNPIPIVIPCHRVVKSDGQLGGYTAGVDRKKKLLELEGVVL